MNGRTFSARIRAYGERHYVRFGHSRDGWTRARAEAELANILADVRRGLWVPEPATSIPEPPKSEPTFHEFASEWFDRAKRELRANTVLALRIYAQAMRRGEEEKAALGALVQGIDWARLGTKRASAGSPRRSTETKGATKPGRSRASSSGRGWVRTSDLSRVRRALSH
jgi:hypothetical protein